MLKWHSGFAERLSVGFDYSECRWVLMVLSVVLVMHWRAFLLSDMQPEYHTEDILNGSPVEPHQQLLWESQALQAPQEVKLLETFVDHCCGVHSPNHVMTDDDPEVLHALHNLHSLASIGDGAMDGASVSRSPGSE